MIDGTMQDYPLTLDKFLRHAAKWHPRAQVATAREGGAIERIGYADMQSRALAISSLLAGFGVQPGDRVATLAWNSQPHVESWYAVMGIGAVCHTLNPRLTAAQLGAMAAQSEAKLLVASADLLPHARNIAERASGIERILVIDGHVDDAGCAGVPVTPLEPLIATAPGGAIWGDFAETTPSGLCFTSGTTGAPKGVSYTHRACFLHTLRCLQADVMAVRATDSVLVVVPMFHANAWGLPFTVPAAGAKLVLPGRYNDGASLARLIAAEQVTIGVAVPTVWLGLVEHLEVTGGELPSLQRIIVGGSPLHPP
jgi:fatty-acyl-CoA synthase